MKVVKNPSPPPPPPPPVTYDILGLTENEFALMTAIAGAALDETRGRDERGVVKKLFNGLATQWTPWTAPGSMSHNVYKILRRC